MPSMGGSAATGALSGASTGSAFGPWGALAGGVLGGIGGLFGGKSKKPKKVPTMDPQQQALYNEFINSLMGKGGQFGSDLQFDPKAFNEMFDQNYAQPAYQNYQEEVVPTITGQFRGNNLQNSSYLGGALAKEGSRVQSDINAKRSAMMYQGQQDAAQRRMDAVQRILGMSTFGYQKRQPNALESILEALMEQGGSYLSKRFGA